MKAAVYTNSSGVYGLAVDPTVPAHTTRITPSTGFSQVMSIIPLDYNEMIALARDLLVEGLRQQEISLLREAKTFIEGLAHVHDNPLVIEHFEKVHDGYICKTCPNSLDHSAWTEHPITHLVEVHHFQL